VAFVPVAGGSCLNVAIGMARLGTPAGFAGGLSTDLFGRIIADHAERSDVDLRYATRSAHPTTLAFVQMVGGEPQYAFYDEATASRCWRYRKGAIPFAETEAIHIGSTTLLDPTGAAETLAMVEDARGLTSVSFDPNCRPNRLPSVRRANLECAQKAREFIEFVGLGHEADRIAGGLPYGALKRLEIARALASEPKLLLLDEPAAGCNPVETEEIDGLIQQIARKGTTVALVEHDMKLVMRISDRILVLDRGRKLTEGGTAEVRNNPDVIRAYLGSHGTGGDACSQLTACRAATVASRRCAR
jgi:sugar/nucleoside kinase (ribokinase family)